MTEDTNTDELEAESSTDPMKRFPRLTYHPISRVQAINWNHIIVGSARGQLFAAR